MCAHPQISLGCIVALVSHPFFASNDKDSILISGDAVSLSPLMVVVESLKGSSKTDSQKSEQESTNEEFQFQYKCLWYSNKTSAFKDFWIAENLLKVIEAQPEAEVERPPFGSSVFLKTATIEIGKKKLSFNQKGILSEDNNKSIEGLLSFTSPVMQVIGLAASESKHPLINKKTKEVKRVISKELIRCKYYDVYANKFSDVLIPVEALSIIKQISGEYLATLFEYILSGVYLKTKSKNPTFDKTLIKPFSINYKLGLYYLEAKDLIENKLIEVEIEGLKAQFIPINSEFDHLPIFESTGKHLNIRPIRKDTIAALPSDKFWRIKYKDANDNVTTRTIYNADFYYSHESDMDEETITVDYIKAICLNSKQQERYFRVDRIQLLEVLELQVSETISEDKST